MQNLPDWVRSTLQAPPPPPVSPLPNKAAQQQPGGTLSRVVPGDEAKPLLKDITTSLSEYEGPCVLSVYVFLD